ncbi:hypothetical protein QTG54_008650 [Skeletonema marinoi]|uniref:Integrator complex subunit 7 n=1 Tax=Skeletonema marinoi TaxID=267567 RepID=A0AAD8Y8N7_9STRA|nr:hypothetical protein QTG54_008650 [Skeletonema marinoi]
MLDATDLTTTEVRTQYVQPLIEIILAKTNLTAATLGIQYSKSSTTAEAAPTSSEKDSDEGVIGTLYQEIALYESDEVHSSTCDNNKSYAEILEEASALSAYLTREEQTLVATVASSALVSFLIPQCDYLNFLHSYFTSTSGTASSETISRNVYTLEERLTNAMIWNQDSASQEGSVFPYSASRMRSSNDDGFTTAYFYRFLDQGLASYLSCGMTFCSNKSVIRKQAFNDIIQLISMAICPVTPQSNVKPKSVAPVKESSLLPFSFQLSHVDRLHLLRVCKELAMTSDATTNNQAALAQLRESLFGFASYVAHSDKEAAAAYEALVNTSLIENDESCIQFEFQRLLQTLVESKSPCIINSTCLCIEEMILKYKGNKNKLHRFALRLLAKKLDAEINSAKDTRNNLSNTSTTDAENVAKRQKRFPDNCKPFRLIAIMKAAGVLFSTGGGLRNASEGDVVFEAEAAIKQMIQNTTILLQCSADDQLDIVQSASECLALVLSNETSYLIEKSNVKHIFTHVRQSLLSSSNDKASSAIIDALKPLIVICSRQSRTCAVSFLSFAIKTYSARERVLWKLATCVSIGNPLAVSTRLSNLGESSSDEDIATCKIRTILSSTCGKAVDASPSDPLQRCLSLTESISDMWVLFKLVRVAFQTSNYSFARAILETRLVRGCSRQQSFMYFNALSTLAHGEEVLAVKGAKGIAESMELLSSCNSLLTSLAALEQNDKFGFQLEFIRLRLDTLNLIAITRSLYAEILMTEGTLSGKNNRTTLFRKNIGKSFGLLVSRLKKMYRLWGLHRCQQTRSTLRTLQAMCQLLSEFTKYGTKEAKNSSTPTSTSAPTQSMNMTLSKLRTDVLEQMPKLKQKDDSVSHASGLLLGLDVILKCPCPFPSGFFLMKPIPRAIVNISADPNILPKTISQNDDHDVTVDAKSGAEVIDAFPGLVTKVILSGVLPEKFIQTADVAFSEIIAWTTLQYEGQLYEEDDAVDSDVGGSNRFTLRDGPDSGETAGTLLPAGKFIMPVTFEPLLQEGYYKVIIELGCRDVRGGEWKVPTSSPLEVIFRVDDEGSI